MVVTRDPVTDSGATWEGAWDLVCLGWQSRWTLVLFWNNATQPTLNHTFAHPRDLVPPTYQPVEPILHGPRWKSKLCNLTAVGLVRLSKLTRPAPRLVPSTV